MSERGGDAGRRAGLTIRLGKRELTGWRASAAVWLVRLAIVGAVVLLHPAFRWGWLWVSAALWIAFAVYWGRAAANSSPVARSESDRSRALHATLLTAGQVLLFLRVPGLKTRWCPSGWEFVAAGLALHAASFALAVWARRHLGRNWSGAVTVKVGHELVRSGPYRLVRHPIYTAMFGMFAGTALVSGETHALMAIAILVMAYARKIRQEDRVLAEAFGASFAEYRKHSRALIPWVF